MVGRMKRESAASASFLRTEEETASRSCLKFRFPPRPPKQETRYAKRNDDDDEEEDDPLLTRQIHATSSSYENKPRYPITPDSSAESSRFEHLLTPPKATDRSPRTMALQRQQQAHNPRRRGVYDGEMEPEGVRGQEATVVPNATPSADLPVRTSFPSEALQFSPATGEAVPLRKERIDPVRSPSPINPSNSSRLSASKYMQRMPSDVESTTSDDDIRYMMPDLIPQDSSSQDHQEPSPAVITPEPTRRQSPSPVNLDQINATALDHVHRGQFQAALTLFQNILQIHQDRGDQVLMASAHHNLGTVHSKCAALHPEDSMAQRKAQAKALEHFQAAARAARDSLGRNHPNVAVSLVRIGFLLLSSRQYQTPS